MQVPAYVANNVSLYRRPIDYRALLTFNRRKSLTSFIITGHLQCIYFRLQQAHCLCKRDYSLGLVLVGFVLRSVIELGA